MIELGLALWWFTIVLLAVMLHATAERRARLARTSWRRDLIPPHRLWGGELDRPPSTWPWARLLSAAARAVRSRGLPTEPSRGLRRLGRVGSVVSIAMALALVPFAGTWGGRPDGRALVVLDPDNGLLALVLLILLSDVAQVSIGLSDQSVWSRLGAVRIAGRALASIGLLVLVLGALVLETGSLRLHDLVLAQRGSFAPAAWLGSLFHWQGSSLFEVVRLPNWLALTQPLTAILFVPTLVLLLRRPLAFDPASALVGAAGFGLDDDPTDRWVAQLEQRLAAVLAASLFVVLFLGAGALPYVDSTRIAGALEPFVGEFVPGVLLIAIESGVFLAKLGLVFAVASKLRDASARLRDDQWLRLATRRLAPIAWANLLLVAALRQLSATWGELI